MLLNDKEIGGTERETGGSKKPDRLKYTVMNK